MKFTKKESLKRDRQYKRIKALREKILKEANYICHYCGKKGNDNNMGIGPDKHIKIFQAIPLHIYCNPPYYGYDPKEDNE